MSIAFQRSSENSGAVPRGGPGTHSNFNLDRNDRGIERSGFAGQSTGFFRGAGGPSELGRRKFGEDRGEDSDSSTSSIGRNSDEEVSSAGRSSEGAAAGECEEVQSTYKRGALDSLESLEEVLPMKRSISQFYCGKSKSFTSLSDAATCSSMNEIVKPENAYTRKRKNLLAHSTLWDNKNRNTIRRSNMGGISKRSAGSKSTLALAASMGCSESANNSDSSNSNSSSPSSCLPPLPPQRRRSHENTSSASPPEQNSAPWRSFSLSDLQGANLALGISGFGLNNRHT